MNIRSTYGGKIALLLIVLGLLVAKGAEVTKENYTVTMKDGTVLVGEIQINRIKFNASYGSVDVSLGEIVSFGDGFLTLSDESKLKGSFPSGNLTLQTPRGSMDLPFDAIASIAKHVEVAPPANSTAPPSSPATAPPGNAPNLIGQIVDCFGAPLSGVSAAVENSGFVTKTDDQGNYSLSYVPGTIKVIYSKPGYYSGSLTFQIATPSRYPVQELQMFKVPTGKSIFFPGKNGYLALAQARVQIQNIDNKGGSVLNPGQVIMQSVYSIAGQPTLLPGGKELTFLDTDEVYNSVLRVKPNREFYRRLMYGLGMDFKHEYELIQEQDAEIAPGVFVRKMTLTAGTYVFITTTMQSFEQTLQMSAIGGGMGEPAYLFRVGLASSDPTANGTEATSTQPPAQRNPFDFSRPANSEETHAQPPTQRTPFEELTISVPQANLFLNHVKDFAFPYDKVWDAVSKVVTEQKENVTKSDMEKGTLMTDVTKHTILGLGYYDQYCLLVEKVSDTSTRVNLKLLRFELGLGGQKVPSEQNVVTPKAKAFFDKITTKLQTGK